MKKFTILLAALLLCLTAYAQEPNNMDNASPEILLQTSEGDIIVRLYPDTPIHRDNFLKLTREGYYDGMLFHRVIKDFMVQTGDPNSKNPENKEPLGAGSPPYTLEAEILYPTHFHKYGALAAARTGDQVNPERRSSGSQFYIVTGQKYQPSTLKNMEGRLTNDAMQAYFSRLVQQNREQIQALREAGDNEGLNALQQKLIAETEANVKPVQIPAEVVETYTQVGGTPHLDGAYTVFGEVVKGMDVVEKIQSSATDPSDRPQQDIRIIKASVIEK